MNGFMNRFLIAPAAPRSPKANAVEVTPVPQVIVDTLTGMVPELPGNLGGLLGVFSSIAKVQERQLGWGPGAEAAADDLDEAILTIMDAKPPGYQLLGRTFEYAVRLAGVHAVSRGGALARVEMDDLSWGAAWALDSARSMMDAAANLMARNEYEANVNAIKAVIREAGTIRKRDVLRKVQNINARERDGIIDQLAEAEVIEKLSVKPGEKGGRPTMAYRWIG